MWRWTFKISKYYPLIFNRPLKVFCNPVSTFTNLHFFCVAAGVTTCYSLVHSLCSLIYPPQCLWPIRICPSPFSCFYWLTFVALSGESGGGSSYRGGNRRNLPMFTYRNSCTTCHPLPSRATPATSEGHTEAIRVQIVSIGLWLVSTLTTTQNCKKRIGKRLERVAWELKSPLKNFKSIVTSPNLVLFNNSNFRQI